MCNCSYTIGKKQVPFSVAIENWELMHARVLFPRHSAWEQQE